MTDQQKNTTPPNRDAKPNEKVEDLAARDASGNDEQVKGGRMKLDPLKKGNP